MTADDLMYESLFGSLPALTNGVVLRLCDGVRKNLFVVFDNGGISERSVDVSYPTKVPAATYAYRAVKTFAGQENHGVTLRLNGSTNDTIKLVVRDNLIDAKFTKFSCLVQGHVVE